MWCVPMLESERGWGSKIDGYVGPFEDQAAAKVYMDKYNLKYKLKYNNEPTVPDYYIAAQDPVERPDNFKCNYRVQDL